MKLILLIILFVFSCSRTPVDTKPRDLSSTKELVSKRLKESEHRFDVKCWTSTKNISNLMFGFQTDDKAFHLREKLISDFSIVLWKYAQDLNRDKDILSAAEIEDAVQTYSRIRFNKTPSGINIQLLEGVDNKLSKPIFISDLDLFDYQRTSNSWKTLFAVANGEAEGWNIKTNLSLDGLDKLAWYVDLYAITLIKKMIESATTEGSPMITSKHVKRSYLGLFLSAKIDGWSPGGRYAERAFSQSVNYALFKVASLRHVNKKISDEETMKVLSKIAGLQLSRESFETYKSILKEFTNDLWRQAQAVTPDGQYMVKGLDMYEVIMKRMPYKIDDLSNVIFYPNSEKPRLYQEFEGDTVRDDAYHWILLAELHEEKARKTESDSPKDYLLPLDVMASEEVTELVSSYAVPLLKDAAVLAMREKSAVITSKNLFKAHKELLGYTDRYPEKKVVDQKALKIPPVPWSKVAFEDVTKKMGVETFEKAEFLSDQNMQAATLMSYDAFRGISTGDINNDGFPDLFIAHENGLSKLYLNQNGETFRDISIEWNLPNLPGTTGAHFIDYNNDGCKDLFVLRPYETSRLLKNTCNRSFVDVTETSNLDRKGIPLTGAIWFDANSDGLLDLYLIATGDFKNGFLPMMGDFTNAHPNVLMMQTKDGHFRDATKEAGVGDQRITLAAVAFDADGDGDQDLYLVNDGSRNILLENRGDGKFKDVSVPSGTDDFGNGMGVSVADVNNDGKLDLYVTNISLWNPRNRYIRPDRETQMKSDKDVDRNLRARQTNRLFINRGKLKFTDEHAKIIPRYTQASWGWDNFFVDIDNSGEQDLMVINGFRPESFGHHNEENFLLYYTEETKTMEIVPRELSGVNLKSNSRAGIQFDFDLDGKLDLAVSGLHSPVIYKNQIVSQNNWIKLKLVGKKSNRDGFGALVTVKNKGKNQTLQQGTIGGGFLGYHNLPLHFGTGKADIVDEILIKWPSGKRQVLKNQKTNQLLTVLEP